MIARAAPETRTPVRRRERLAVGVLLLLLVGMNLAVMSRTSETLDERFHVDYGRRLLAGHPERIAAFDSSKMPVSAANALPSVIADSLPAGLWKNRLGGLAAARLATVGAAALLALVVWAWARRLYGPVSGGVALFLCAFDPNLLAHSHLATTDVYTALGFTAAFWTAWRASRAAGLRPLFAHGAALGFAQLTKYFALLAYPLLAAIEAWRARRARRPLAPVAGRWALALAVSLVVVAAGFRFDRPLRAAATFEFWSKPFQRLAATPLLGALPIPLPAAYLEGLDMALDAERERPTYGRTYLLGRLHEKGVPGYYLIAALVKVPLPVLILGAVALAGYVARRRRFAFWDDEVYYLAPLAAFTLYLNFYYNAQIGIRHALIVFPFGYLLIAALFVEGWPEARRRRLALGALALWLVASFAAAYPYYIPYFNELLPDRKFGYRILSDSNVDWGQATGELRAWLAAHPEAVYAPQTPVAGRVVVSVNGLTGVVAGERFAWLRPLSPVDHVAYSYLVFEVSEPFAAAARARGAGVSP